MKLKAFLTKIALAGVLVALSSTNFVWAKPPEIGSVPPLKFSPPKPARHVLSNGVVVFVLEDHELPLFSMSLKLKVSPVDEPADKKGSMGLMGNLWRAGGTRRLSPEALNDQLETAAIQIESSAGEESAGVSVSCLMEDQDKALGLFRDVFFEPAFQSGQLQLAKAKILESIRRKNDDPWNIGRRAFRDVTYGADHYYAWNPTPASLSRIARADLAALHKKILDPKQAQIAVSGNFKTTELLAALESLFGGWSSQSRIISPYDYTVRNGSTGTVFYVEKDLTQSLIYMGALGVSRHDPDLFSLNVANSILGEGGTSRLFGEIRSRLGLAYVVASFYTVPRGLGLVGAVVQTKGASTGDAVKALQKELIRIGHEPVQTAELQQAKDSILNSFVFRFDSSAQIVQESSDLEFFGFPPDYLETYPDRIRNVQARDIQTVSRKYFQPGRFRILVVGNQKLFGKPLSEFGPVTQLPLELID